MKRQVKRGFIIIAAVFFLMLGAIGFVLPFLPGFVFIAIALILLSLISLTLRDYIEKHTSKYPTVHRFISKMDAAVRRVVGEI
jgi:uncharacterized membrane protein YbaN (DUF454 family)